MEEYQKEIQGNPVEQLSICSQPGSRNCANQLPALDKEKVQKMIAGSGLRCLRRYEKLPQATAFSKMFLASLVSKGEWYSSSVALIWKLRGTKFNRSYFQLAVKTLPTDGTGFGLLLTPNCGDVNHSRGSAETRKKQYESGHQKQLAHQIAMLGTAPTAESGIQSPPGDGKKAADAQTAGGLLPTPASRDYKGANSKSHCEVTGAGRKHMDQLPNALMHGTNTGLKLQPAFVEWMLGYPIGWTALEK